MAIGKGRHCSGLELGVQARDENGVREYFDFGVNVMRETFSSEVVRSGMDSSQSLEELDPFTFTLLETSPRADRSVRFGPISFVNSQNEKSQQFRDFSLIGKDKQ
jgi:hypothetical protein